VKWAGGKNLSRPARRGHAITIDSDRHSNTAPGRWILAANGLRGLHGDGHVSILVKKRKAGVAGSVCWGSVQREPPNRLEEAGNRVPPPRASSMTGGEVRHSGSARTSRQVVRSRPCSRKTAAVSWRYEIQRRVLMVEARVLQPPVVTQYD